MHERVQFTYFWIGAGMHCHCCRLVQAWPACTLWCWWCRRGYGVYATRERVRPRRKERRRPASIWSCELSVLQSFTEPVDFWSWYSFSLTFCDVLPLSAHYIILLVESVLFGVFVMVIFYDQVGTHAHTSDAYICGTLTLFLKLKQVHLVQHEHRISDLMFAEGVTTSIAGSTHRDLVPVLIFPIHLYINKVWVKQLSVQRWANYDLRTLCGPLSFLILLAEFDEIILYQVN